MIGAASFNEAGTEISVGAEAAQAGWSVFALCSRTTPADGTQCY